MNFSKTSQLKKHLSMILILTMLVSVFAGCKKTTPSSNTNETLAGPNLVETAPSTEEPAATEAPKKEKGPSISPIPTPT